MFLLGWKVSAFINMPHFSPRWHTRKWWFSQSSTWSHRFLRPTVTDTAAGLWLFHSSYRFWSLLSTQTWWYVKSQWGMKWKQHAPPLHDASHTYKWRGFASAPWLMWNTWGWGLLFSSYKVSSASTWSVVPGPHTFLSLCFFYRMSLKEHGTRSPWVFRSCERGRVCSSLWKR